jgi:hypothetical protein
VDDFNLNLDDNEDDDNASDTSFDPIKDKDVEQAGVHDVEEYAEDERQLDCYPDNDSPQGITRDIFKMSLGYLMFLKRKRCGKIKARGCADGRPQREYITKDQSSSPTVPNNALFATCLVDAIEKRAVAICNIPGAFLQANWPENEPCYIRFEGIMVDMICQIKPSYIKCIKYGRNKRKLMIGKLSKAIYGTLLGARLFYDKL